MSETLRRAEHYNGRIIVTDGQKYGAFWTAKRYPSLEAVRAAIDDGSAFDGIDQLEAERRGVR